MPIAAEVAGDGAATIARGRARPVRPLSAVAFVILAAVSLSSAFISQKVVSDQDDRLLERRASEVAALMSLSVGRTQEAFRSLTTIVQLSGPDSVAFGAAANSVISARLFTSVAIVQEDGVQEDGGTYRILAAEGPGLTVGGPLSEAGTPAFGRAGAGGVFVTTPAYRKDDLRHLGFAALVDGVSPRTLIFGESRLDRPAGSGSQAQSSSTRAFGDLAGGFYTGDKISAEQAVILSPGFDGTGRVATRDVAVGADRWLLAISPSEPLVGALAQRQPWILLIGGLITALLVGGLVEVLLRRRQYADSLVAERTEQLSASLRELDAAQHRLVQQERLAAIGQLASAVGHELRNPLGVLSNVIYLLGTRLGREDPWIDRQLKTAEREVAASSLIVSDLLEYSRPREPMYGAVDVRELLDEVLSVAPPPDLVEVVRQLPEDLPALRADRDQLRQVLLNLVGNAYDAMAEGGLLVLQGEAGPDGVRLTVADTGPGIADDVLDRLFEPFFTTKAKGIGLGLAVAHRIVDGHGGALTARSNPGPGASFSLLLPPVAVPVPVSGPVAL